MGQGWGARLLITACAAVLGGCGVGDEGSSGTDIDVEEPGAPSGAAVHEAVTAPLRFVAVADATARAAYPSSNYAAESTLNVDRTPDEEVFLRFQVSGASAGVSKAVLRLYATNGSSAGPALYATGATWSESSLTWNTRPSRTSGSLGTRNPTVGAFVEYDVTSIVRGDGAFGFVLVPMSTDGADFASRESTDASRRPELVITLAGSTEPPPPPPPSGSELRFVASDDASIQQTYPSTNYGRTTALLSDTSPGESAFMRFSVTGVSTTVSRAEVRLYVTNGSSNGPALYAASNSWSETAVTWNSRPARSGQYGDAGSIAAGQWLSYDVTSLVKGNGEFSFELVATSSDGTDVASREYGDATKRPVLVLTTGGSTEPPSSGSPQLITVGPIADTYVSAVSPGSSYGSSSMLVTDSGSGDEVALLRFRVAPPPGRILSAKLRLFVLNGSGDGPKLVRVAPTWSESSMWAQNPAVIGPPMRDLGSIATGSWVELDVSGAIKTSGDYDFALHPTSTDGADFASREHPDPGKRPQLVLTVDPTRRYVETASTYRPPDYAIDNGPIVVDATTRDRLFVTHSYGEATLTRMNATGTISWQRVFDVHEVVGEWEETTPLRIEELAQAPDGTFLALVTLFSGAASLDDVPLSPGAYVFRFGAAGQLIEHARVADASVEEKEVTLLSVGPSGEVVLGGAFRGAVRFGSETHVADQSTSAFVWMLGAALEHRWARSFTADPVAQTSDLAIAPNGDVVAAIFRYESDGAYGYGSVVRLSPAGPVLWEKLLGDSVSHVALSKLGTVAAAVLDDGNSFLIALEANGVQRWRLPLAPGVMDLAIDDAGGVRLIGLISHDGDLGGGATGLFEDQRYVARINLDGTFQWMTTYPSTPYDRNHPRDRLALHPDGTAYVVGAYRSSIRIDDRQLTSGTTFRSLYLIQVGK